MKNGRNRLLVVLAAIVLFLWGNAGNGIRVVEAAAGATYNVGVLTYTEKSDGTLTVTGRSGYSEDETNSVTVSIPSSYNGMAVTEIGAEGFAEWYFLESIQIPDTITSIGNNAFDYCESLKTVTIPDSVTTLGEQAFEYCYALTTVDLSDNIRTIEDKTFLNCKALTGIDLPANLTAIGDYAFSQTKLSSVVLPDGVVAIGEQAFRPCTTLTDVTLPAGVATIGDSAFPNSSALTIHCYSGSAADQTLTNSSCYSDIVIDRKTVTNKVTSITLNQTSLSLNYKDTYQLTATILPENADVRSVAWSSDNSYITVDQTGLVTVNGVTAAGYPATITATAGDGSGVTATCTISASLVSVTSVTLNKSDEKINIGDTLQLVATVLPESATNRNVTWSSSNTVAATVDSNGLVTAKKEGTANIYATVSDNGNQIDAVCIVTVQSGTVSVQGITLTPTNATVTVGGTTKVTAAVTPANATNQTLAWSSSNENIATVDSTGNVTAKGTGTVTITAAAQDGSNVKGTCTITINPILVTGITLSAGTKSMVVGETYQLSATSIIPANATNKNIVWSSSNSSIVGVSTSGLITANKAGSATVTATAADGSGITAVCSITVNNVLVNKITLSQTNVTLNVEEFVTLQATVEPANAYNRALVWTSSNPSIAEVTSAGKVTAKAPGTVTITAASTDGSDVSASCTVKVNPILVSSITLTSESTALDVGNKIVINKTIAPVNATNQTVTWTSSNPSVVTVDQSGNVTAVAPGTVTITAASTDGSNVSASCTVKVNPILVSSITLTSESTALDVGNKIVINKTIAPVNATNQTVTWTSSNTSVVTVDQSGNVTAVAPGTAVITAAAKDGSGVSDTITITVNKILVENISVTPSVVNLQIGDHQQLTAAVTPSTASEPDYTWTSNNMLVATVDSNGYVTAVGAGSAVITAAASDGSNVKGECAVTVEKSQGGEEDTNKYATAVSLNSTSKTLKVNESFTLTATIEPADATLQTVTWESSDLSVATVENGIVTARKPGNTTITARTQDGTNITATCKITVETVPVTGITLSASAKSMVVGETYPLSATSIIPANATNKNIVWSSSDSSIVGVSTSGLITANKAGSATVTATAADGSGITAVCSITVNNVLVNKITLSQTNVTLNVEEFVTLQATVEPANAYNRVLVWTSSNPSIAEVTSAGKVTAKASGTVTITAAATDGSGVSSTITIIVNKTEEQPVLVTSITLNAASKVLYIGDTFRLMASIAPENADNQSVVWSSDNPSIAEVDKQGYITAKSAGKATIKVSAADSSGVTASCTVTVKEKITTPETPEPLGKGTVRVVSACTVKVTSSDKSNPTVAYVKPSSTKATKATIPDKVTIEGITYKVTSIADNAFKGNKKLKTVTFGKNLVLIGKNAFTNCKKLSKVTIKSASLTTIGANAFKGCTSLKSVTISSKVLSSIGANAFSGDKKLTTIKLSTTKLTKKKVGKNAFKGTSKKLTIKVPSKAVTPYKKFMKTKGNKKVKVKK